MSEKLSGYRTLTDLELEVINQLKFKERQLLQVIDEHAAVFDANPRCVALAKTNIEQGFMWAIRSIAKPLQ